MTDANAQPSLLDQLEARQDEVIRQLDELNERVEALLGQFTLGRHETNGWTTNDLLGNKSPDSTD